MVSSAEQMWDRRRFMKAVLVLVLIYIGTFLVAIQGASQNSMRPQGAQAQQAAGSIDPAKEADIRALLELVGARDAVQDAAARGAEQFRENLLASLPDNQRSQQFVNAFVDEYQKRFDADEVTSHFVAAYDKHFTDDEIKGLLQFYGSPLGQRYAAEMPKVTAEIQAANRGVNMRLAKDVIQDLHKQYPGVAAHARLNKNHPNHADAEVQQAQTQPQNR
jgi:hypothetical protein